MIDTADRNQVAALVATLGGAAVVVAVAAGQLDGALSTPLLGAATLLTVAALVLLYRLRTA